MAPLIKTIQTHQAFFSRRNCRFFTTAILFPYNIHTEIYTLKSRRVNFRLQTDVNQSNVAYRFCHM